MKRQRTPDLPTNVYRLPSGRYAGYLRVNGQYRWAGTFAAVEEAAQAVEAISATRRPPRYLSICWRSDRRKWRVKVGPNRRNAGSFATWDDAWEALLREAP